MRKLVNIILLGTHLLVAGAVWAKSPARQILPVEKCLNIVTNAPQECMKKHMNGVTIRTCYALSEKIYSYHARENVKSHCFYNVSEFSHLDVCLGSAQKFFLAEDRDAALFECFRQFSQSIDQKSCLKISKKMIFQEKRNYLANHCRTL